MSLLYYSRIRFITKLMPLLAASQRPSHVISICLAGKEAGGKLFTEDLSLRSPGHYSFVNVRTHVVHMKTMAFETFAQQNPGQISLVHVFPGLVITPAFNSSSLPLWFRMIWLLLAPIARMYSVKPQEIGERILGFASNRFPARAARQAEEQNEDPSDVAKSTDGVVGGGAYSTKYDGHVNSVQETYQKLRPGNFRMKAWDHTMKAFEEIEAGHVFEE